MPRCAVVGCKVYAGNKEKAKFFRIPKNDVDLRRQWISNINRRDWEPMNSSRVCGRHFVDGQPTADNPYPILHMGYDIKKKNTRQSNTSKASGKLSTQPKASPSKVKRIGSTVKDVIDKLVPNVKSSTPSTSSKSSAASSATSSAGTSSKRAKEKDRDSSSSSQDMSKIYRRLVPLSRKQARKRTKESANYEDPTNPETPRKKKARMAADLVKKIQKLPSDVPSPSQRRRSATTEGGQQDDDHPESPLPFVELGHVATASPTNFIDDETFTESASQSSESPQRRARSLPPKRKEAMAKKKHHVSMSSLDEKKKEKLLIKYKNKYRDQRQRLQETEQEIPFGWHRLRGDDDVNMWTGFPSCAVFDRLFNDYLEPDANSLSITTGTKSRRPQARRLSVKDEILVVLIRLRMNLPAANIAHLFKVDETYVGQIINAWIPFMAKKLGAFVNWIPREERGNLPEAFRKFPKCVAVIDCFELQVEKPTKLSFRQKLWSEYKQRYTAKFLVVMSPNGTIMYVSRAWTGRASDKHIVVNSTEFLDSLEPYDEVMADRGFNIASFLLINHRVQLRVPPHKERTTRANEDDEEDEDDEEEEAAAVGGRKKKKKKGVRQGYQFPRADIVGTRTLASARIHVERCIGQLRNFRILSQCYKASMFHLIDDVATICAAICNLHPPLVS